MINNNTLLRVGNISGMYYSCGIKTKTVLVYGIGAPNVPDNGNLLEAKVVIERKIDLFVPDYIGFGRSSGKFTPKNCINTFLKLYEFFSLGTSGVNYYAHKNIMMKYERIIFAGRSLGGAYVPLLPRYNNSIKEIGIIFGALDQSEQGSIRGEETNEDFVDSMLLDGYKYLYKGFDKEVWWKHLNDEDGLSPMENIKYLKDVKVFIAHGKKDNCINFSKSLAFYKSLLDAFPDKKDQYKLKLYKKSGHDSITAKAAIHDYLNWIDA